MSNEWSNMSVVFLVTTGFLWTTLGFSIYPGSFASTSIGLYSFSLLLKSSIAFWYSRIWFLHSTFSFLKFKIFILFVKLNFKKFYWFHHLDKFKVIKVTCQRAYLILFLNYLFGILALQFFALILVSYNNILEK